jgi:hypothetical protein
MEETMENKSVNDRFELLEKEITEGVRKIDIIQDNFRKLREEINGINPEVIQKKSNEELVFELIRDDMKHWYNIDNYEPTFLDLKCTFDKVKIDVCKQWLFLVTMKGVHKLIEGDRKYNKKENNYVIEFFSTHVRYDICRFTNRKTYPSFFYFSSTGNANIAYDILSTFFDVNILDWWHKA